jgi:hypothetical protein
MLPVYHVLDALILTGHRAAPWTGSSSGSRGSLVRFSARSIIGSKTKGWMDLLDALKFRVH